MKTIKKNIGISFGGPINQEIESKHNTQIQSSNTSTASFLSQKDFEHVDPQQFRKFIEELNQYEDEDVARAKKAVLSVMNAQYASSPGEFKGYLDAWNKDRKTLSEKTLKILGVAADVAGLASFISMLLGAVI